MSDIDVSQLSAESLTDASFPASRSADFRVYFPNDVHAAIAAHAAEDTSIEICGVLVGEWQKDEDGPFAAIRNFIRCDNAASKNAEVTFTHESWAQINDEMDSKYSDQRIIGWYHSHPDFGIFLSDRDMFIQEHFFNGPGQIAYVVDPVRKLEGVFEWRSSKAAVMTCYWVGDRVVTSAASESSDRPLGSTTGAATGHSSRADAYLPGEGEHPSASPTLPSTTVMLAWLCVFLLGYLLNDLKSNWERQYVMDGVVAHYGLWNILQIGRAEQVEETRKRVELAFDAVTELASEHAGLVEGESQKQLRDRWQKVRKQLADARDTLQSVEDRYSVPDDQRDLLSRVVIDRLMSLTSADARRPLLPVPIPAEMMNQIQPSPADGPDAADDEPAATTSGLQSDKPSRSATGPPATIGPPPQTQSGN